MGNNMTENKKGFLQNDRKLLSSMFVFYGICLLGGMVATFWGLDQRRQAISTNITSTAFTRASEQDQYEFIERFSPTSTRWFVGPRNNQYWEGSMKIEGGVYVWDIEKVKKTFTWPADFYAVHEITDFDVYVDTKVLDTAPGDVCSGFEFRKWREWDNIRYYYFALCSDSSVFIGYRSIRDGSEEIASISYNKRSNDWNRLEIVARGPRFTFLINGDQIYEMDDDRQNVGGLALTIGVNEKVPAKVMFDNFGFQSR
jgi:hypothetical protein